MTRSNSVRNKRNTLPDWCNVLVLVLLFLASLNFVTRYYYWIFIAFAVFLVTPGRKIRMNLSAGILIILGIAMTLFDPESHKSFTNLIKPYVFAIAYIIGFGMADPHDDHTENIERIKKVIYVSAFGLFLHYVLNMITNFGALERDTVDIWTRSVLSATGQASLASMCVGIAAAFLFSKTSLGYKIVGITFSVLILLYNLVLAGRTLLFMMAIMFVLAYLYQTIYYKKNLIKGFIWIGIVVTILLIMYNMDLFHIKSMYEASNFYLRFFARNETTLIHDSRLGFKLQYLSEMLNYPFGGGHIRAKIGFYAHDLYLDSYDQFGIFGFAMIVIYIVSSLVRMVRCLRRPELSFFVKQLIFCVYIVLNIQFWIEPIMRGMPWLFMLYCLIDGTVGYYLTTKPRVGITDER